MPRKVLFLSAAFLLLAVFPGPLRAQTSADLSLSKDDGPDPVTAGSPLTYTLTLSNEGPDDASAVTLDDTLPDGTTFQSLASPAGWSCSTPAVGSGGTVSCSAASFAPGSEVFTLTVLVDVGVASGTVLTNTATVSSTTPDPNPGAETATAQTTVTGATTVISLAKTDSPDPVTAGGTLTYTLTAGNNGANDLESATVTDPLPAGTTFVSLSAPAGWSCSTPAAGTAGTVSCTASPFVPGAAVFTLGVQVGALPGGTVLTNQAALDVTDSGRTNRQTATASTSVVAPALVSVTKSVSGGFQTNGTVVYTVVLTNGGKNTQGDNPGPELTDTLPSGLVLTSATATSGVASANLATNTVTWNGAIPEGGSVTITITALVSAGAGSTVSNQGTIAYDADGNGSNEASAPTDDPSLPGPADPTVFVVAAPAIPTLDEVGLALLAAVLAVVGVWRARR